MNRQEYVLSRLSQLGFSQSDLEVAKNHGMTGEDVLDSCKRLLDLGLTTEGYCRKTFSETYPDVFADYEAAESIGFLSCFKSLSDFEEQKADWLISGYIPRGQITTLASDGGIGKTSAWIDFAAAVSIGKPCFLDDEEITRNPGKVLFLSSEDSVSVVLKRRLIAAGADESRIVAPDFAADANGDLRKLKFGSPELEKVLAVYRPTLCIFDPIQGFIPHGTNMGDRGAMRDCLAPLITWGEKYGTTFLIVAHTNKRLNAAGRDRIADSADLWDISRSVLMMGWSGEDGIRYLSQEKSNYGLLQETVLFSIDREGIIHRTGTTWKRDRDFQGEKPLRKSSKLDCKDWIITTLEKAGGKMPIRDLTDMAERNGYSEGTMKRAKAELSNENKTRTYSEGYGEEKRYFIELTYFVE